MTKGYGFTVDDIDWSSPSDLEPYSKAYKLHIQQQDYMAWIHNQYTLSAVSVAVEHCLAGRKAKSRYIEKPLLEKIEQKNKPMTQEEIERQRLLFISKMNVMKTNFELNNKI